MSEDRLERAVEAMRNESVTPEELSEEIDALLSS